MVRSLGEQFQDTALASIAQSKSCLAAGELDEALSHLSHAHMMGAVRDGVEKVASGAGVAPLSVFKLLPMSKLEELMRTVDSARTKSGDDARATVADAIDGWQQTVQQCCVLIDEARDIGKAYRGRLRRRFAILAVLAMVVGVGGAWTARRFQASSKVSAVLATDDPCTSENVDEKDLKHVGDALTSAVHAARQRCHEQREQHRQQEEEQRLAEEQKRLERQRLEERRKACQRLSDNLESNTLDASDEKLAGSHAELLGRVAAGTIEPPDVARDVSALPCADTSAGKTIRSACASALVSSWSQWLTKETPSTSMRKLIADTKPKLDERTRATLRRKVRQQADGAKLSGKPERLAHSAALCSLLEALAITLPRSCDTP